VGVSTWRCRPPGDLQTQPQAQECWWNRSTAKYGENVVVGWLSGPGSGRLGTARSALERSEEHRIGTLADGGFESAQAVCTADSMSPGRCRRRRGSTADGGRLPEGGQFTLCAAAIEGKHEAGMGFGPGG